MASGYSDSRSEAPPPAAGAAGPKCGRCEAQLAPGQRFCTRCGTPVPVQPSPPTVGAAPPPQRLAEPAPAAAPEPATATVAEPAAEPAAGCRRCGSAPAAGQRFCVRCGTPAAGVAAAGPPVPAAVTPPAPPSPPPPPRVARQPEAPQPPSRLPSGWYPDESRPGRLRYWDGDRWTAFAHHTTHASLSPQPAPTATSTASPSPTGTATFSPGPTARSEAVAVQGLLRQSGGDLARLGNAITQLKQCGNLATATSSLRSVVASRQRLINKLAGLSLAQLPNGPTLQGRLRTALQDSLRADRSYAAWGGQLQALGCQPATATANPDYRAALRLDGPASAAKRSFNSVWGTIAPQYGLPAHTSF
jgi:hypothetical protein